MASLTPQQPCSWQQHWRRRAPPLPPPLAARRRQLSRLTPPHASAASIDEEPALSEDEPLSSSDEPASSSGTSSGPDGGGMRRDTWRVPIPPHLHGRTPRKHWNANALAFLGDSVWELYARRRFFYPPSRKESYFLLVVDHVRAETQERLCQQLLDSGFLTDTERDVLRWGRNATGVTPKRLSDTGLKRETYRAATAMECLVRWQGETGYLYLSDPERLHAMMSLLGLGDAPGEGSTAGGSGGTDGGTSGGSNGGRLGEGC